MTPYFHATWCPTGMMVSKLEIPSSRRPVEPFYGDEVFYALEFRIAGQDGGILPSGSCYGKAIGERKRILGLDSGGRRAIIIPYNFLQYPFSRNPTISFHSSGWTVGKPGIGITSRIFGASFPLTKKTACPILQSSNSNTLSKVTTQVDRL